MDDTLKFGDIKIPDDSIIKGLDVPSIVILCTHYGLPIANRSLQDMKGMLLALRSLFDGRRSSLSHAVAYTLYKDLSLNFLPDAKTATHGELIDALGLHYTRLYEPK